MQFSLISVSLEGKDQNNPFSPHVRLCNWLSWFSFLGFLIELKDILLVSMKGFFSVFSKLVMILDQGVTDKTGLESNQEK